MRTDLPKGSRTNVTEDIALIKSRLDSTFCDTIGAIN